MTCDVDTLIQFFGFFFRLRNCGIKVLGNIFFLGNIFKITKIKIAAAEF